MTTRIQKETLRTAALAAALMITIVPLVGLGDVGAQTEPLDDVIDEVSETVCQETPGTTLPGGVGVECPHGALWVNHYNGPMGQAGQQADDRAHGSLVSPDGDRVFAIGQSRSQPQGQYAHDDLVVLAYDPATGQQLWEARADVELRTSSGYGAVSPDGTKVFVTVRSTVRDDPEIEWSYLTVGYDAATGDELWTTRYYNQELDRGPRWDEPRGLAVSPDSTTVVVTGQSNQASNRTEWGYESAWGTVAYDAETGEELWFTPHFGPSDGGAMSYDVAFSPDGDTAFVTGHNSAGRIGDGTPGNPYTWDSGYVTVAYEAATGALLWEARYDHGEEDGREWSTQVAVSPDSATVFIGGSSGGDGGFAIIVAYDAETGEERWVAHYGPTGIWGSPTGLEVSPDGTTVFTTFVSRTVTDFEEWTTVAYNATTGALLWDAIYRPPGAHPGGQERPYDLALAPDGGTVFVTGWARALDGTRAIPVVAYDAETGDDLWVSLYDREGHEDLGRALAVDPAGERLYATGTTTTTLQGRDITTLAYPIEGPLV